MAGYVYKGNEPATAPLPTRRRKRKPVECGTAAGARRHRHLGEKVCEPCRLAHNRREAERRGGEITERTNRRAAACGTQSGHNAHWRRGETPCDPCRAAMNAYQREYRARKKVA